MLMVRFVITYFGTFLIERRWKDVCVPRMWHDTRRIVIYIFNLKPSKGLKIYFK